MSDETWVMPDWMREVFKCLDLERIWHSPITIERIEMYCSPSDHSFGVSKRLHEVFTQLHDAGLLLTPEQKRDYDDIDLVRDANRDLLRKLTRLKAEKRDGDEALQRESRAAADANREIYRLRAENERVRAICTQTIEEGVAMHGAATILAEEIITALGADDE